MMNMVELQKGICWHW